MKLNTIIFLDFESISRKAHTTQPSELSAVAIDPISLTIYKEGMFVSLMRVEFDEERCQKLKIDIPEQEALDITHLTKEELEKAPPVKTVWSDFKDWIDNYSTGRNQWGRPHLSGYNVINFDEIIVNRLAGKSPYKFGPFDEEYQTNTLFQPIHKFDLMVDFVKWLHMKSNVRSVSMDNLRQYLGIDNKDAHRASKDVLDGAEMLVRMLKLYRHFSPKVSFADSFKKDNSK